MNEIEQLVRDKAVLEHIVKQIKTELERYSNGVIAGVIRLCGSRVWQDLRKVNQELWRQRVRVIDGERYMIKYSVRGKEHRLAIEDPVFADAMDKYLDGVERDLDLRRRSASN